MGTEGSRERQGSEHISTSWGGSMSLAPAAIPLQWGLQVAEPCPWVSQAATHLQVPTPWAAQNPHGWVGWGDTHSTACGWHAADCAVTQGLPPAPTWSQQKVTPFQIPPPHLRVCTPLTKFAPTSPPRTGCLLLRARVPHPGMVKAKKAQVEGRRWPRGLEGDGPTAMSPLHAFRSYLHMERKRPSSVQAEGAAVGVAGHRKAIL